MTKEITTKNNDIIESLKNSYPVEKGFQRTLLPRISFVSQDVTEGKGKKMKVVTEAGTFFLEKPTDEIDENGKSVWDKTELGSEIEGIIVYNRKQLRYYDADTETYTNSPIYDDEKQVIPLFENKKEIDRGTPAELKSREKYKGLTAKGKPTSKLEENRILYVLYDNEMYQLNIRGTSKFAFLDYSKTILPPTVVTKFGSEPKEHGAIAWNQMTFEAVRDLDKKELVNVFEKVEEIKKAVQDEKDYYASTENNDETIKELQTTKTF